MAIQDEPPDEDALFDSVFDARDEAPAFSPSRDAAYSDAISLGNIRGTAKHFVIFGNAYYFHSY